MAAKLGYADFSRQKNNAKKMTEKEKILLGGALELAEAASKRFEFVFQGTENQFRFFRDAIKKKIPNADVTLDNYDDVGFHCSTQNDCKTAFLVGMIVSACYAHFGHLKDTQFE